MATYITFYRLTDQGMREIRDAPKRIDAGIKAFEASGGRLIGFYATTGEYDYVSVTESSEEAGAAFILAQGALGNVRTVTVRAFSLPEFTALVDRLPPPQ